MLPELLPARLRPYAKATAAALLTVLVVGIHWAATGELNRVELSQALTGLAATLLVYATPNEGPRGARKGK